MQRLRRHANRLSGEDALTHMYMRMHNMSSVVVSETMSRRDQTNMRMWRASREMSLRMEHKTNKESAHLYFYLNGMHVAKFQLNGFLLCMPSQQVPCRSFPAPPVLELWPSRALHRMYEQHSLPSTDSSARGAFLPLSTRSFGAVLVYSQGHLVCCRVGQTCRTPFSS